MPDKEIDTGNYQKVVLQGDTVIVMKPKFSMNKDEALRHAAWLVAMADTDGTRFEQVFESVANTYQRLRDRSREH